MSYKTYSPKDANITISGFPIDGWLSVGVEKTADNTETEVSADGRVGITKSADRTGMFTLEVQQQNIGVNTYLAAVQLEQDTSEDVLFLDIVVSDKSGGVLLYLNRSHLQKPADMGLAATASSRTWTFFVEDVYFTPSPSGFEGAATAIANATSAAGSIANNVSNKIA